MAKKRMSETRWLDCLEPGPMLDYLDGKISARKRRLLACAACRYVWDQLTDERSRKAVEIAEGVADGRVPFEELRIAYDDAVNAFCALGMDFGDLASAAAAVHHACYPDQTEQSIKNCLSCVARVGVYRALRDLWAGLTPGAPSNWETLVGKRENGRMARLIREIVGNPFKHWSVNDAQRTDSVIKLARSIYEDRRFDVMTELANSLLGAGCEAKAILEHCRDPRPHYPGCWVLDLVLGKS